MRRPGIFNYSKLHNQVTERFVNLHKIRQSTQNRKSQLENVNIDWNLSQDEGGSIDLSDEDMTVVDNSAVKLVVSIFRALFSLVINLI